MSDHIGKLEARLVGKASTAAAVKAQGSSSSGNLHQAAADLRQKTTEPIDFNKAGADSNKRKQGRGRANSASGRGRGPRVTDQAKKQKTSSNGQAEHTNHKVKSAKVEELSSSEEEKRAVKIAVNSIASDDDEEANADLSLKIVQKSMFRTRGNDPKSDSVISIVTDVKQEAKKKKEKKKRKKKSAEAEVPEVDVSDEIDEGFRDFCGELLMVDNVKGEEKIETTKATEVSEKAVETNLVGVADNAVLRKLLRGPRYFDPPDNSWGACYNCGEEGHTTVNCTSERRKKPCFVCGSFEHNAKLCTKGRDCFICKQQGHRAKDCPEKNSSKLCLKCGDVGHEMFSCRNEYCPDDLKEIQCYICQKFGHLCCVDYGVSDQTSVSCYRCGLSGHTGLACTGSQMDSFGKVSANSCYKCGVEGHFARECTSSAKTSKRNREPSAPKQRSSKKHRDYKEVRSAPHDLGKARKKKKSQHGEFSSPVKQTKHRGGWTTEYPEDSYSSKANGWRSPKTPIDRRTDYHSSHRDYPSSSNSVRNSRDYNYNYNNSAYNGSSSYYQHRFSALRFGNSSHDGSRHQNWW